MWFDDAAPFLERASLGIAAAGLTWSAAALIGRRLAAVISSKASGGIELGERLALGYAAIGSIVAVLGSLNVAFPVIVAALPAIVVVLDARAAYAAARRIPEIVRIAVSAIRRADAVTLCAMLASGAAAITALVAGALPAVWWDPIAYHLPIAAAVLARGAFAFDPSLTQSAFPLLGEAAALPAYALAGSAGAALATLGAGIALAVVCARIAERFAPGAGWIAAALVLTCPLWLWLAPSFYVDIPFALFAIASIGIALRSFAQRRPLDSRSAAFAGVLAGAAAAVKYPGLLVGVVALVFVAAAAARANAMRSAASFVVGAIVVAAGWYVRTAVLTHDPVYPFLTDRLGSDPAVREFAARYVAMTVNWCGGGDTIADALYLPWRMLTGDVQAYCGDPGYALRLGIVFFVFAVAAVRRSWPVGVVAFALTIVWFVGSRQDRFVIPALCAYAIVVAIGAATAPDRLRRVGAVLMIALGLVAVVAEWTPGLIGIASNSLVPAFAYIGGSQTGDAYLGERLEFYAADEWMRSHLPAIGRVAALDDVRDYYAPAVWANPYYQPVIELDWTAAPDARYRQLRARGIDYVVVNANKYYVARTPTGVDWPALADDVRSGVIKPIFSSGDVTVYRLVR